MNIDAENYLQKLPDLLAVITAADFIAIDFEMTGIRVKDSLGTDTPTLQQVYERIVASASTFQAIQMGITAIQWATGENPLLCVRLLFATDGSL